MVSTLVSIYFGTPWLGHAIKINFMKLYTVDPDICSNLIFNEKGLEPVSSPYFVHDFSKKIISHVIFC